jgi:sugar phosphate isomerase/epimerase
MGVLKKILGKLAGQSPWEYEDAPPPESEIVRLQRKVRELGTEVASLRFNAVDLQKRADGLAQRNLRLQAQLAKTDSLEKTVANWVRTRFGDATQDTTTERVDRIIEEACELAQAEGRSFTRVIEIALYVFKQPAGEPLQEMAGVASTLFAYAANKGVKVLDILNKDIERMYEKPIDYFRARHRIKIDAGLSIDPDKTKDAA